MTPLFLKDNRCVNDIRRLTAHIATSGCREYLSYAILLRLLRPLGVCSPTARMRHVARSVHSFIKLAILALIILLWHRLLYKYLLRDIFLVIDISPETRMLQDAFVSIRALLAGIAALLLFRHELRLLSRGSARLSTAGKRLSLALACLIVYNLLWCCIQLNVMPRGFTGCRPYEVTTLVKGPIHSSDSQGIVLIWLGSLVTVPVGEELVFRMALFYVLLCTIGRRPAIFGAALIYSLLHWDRWLTYGWPVGLSLVFFGILSSYVFLNTRRIRWSMIFHSLELVHLGCFVTAFPCLGIVV